MDTIDTVRARDQFAAVVNRAAYGKERIILTRRGKPLAAIVPLDDVELLRELEDRIDLEEARAALEEVKEKGAIPLEKLIADLGLE